jgi:5-methylcytosine-specific restriction endonuclease McrA
MRRFLCCIPNQSLKDRDIPLFIELVTGEKPTDELVNAVTRKRRGPRLEQNELTALEGLQLFRCALCGDPLKGGGQTHVDHIIPVALGGESKMENYQLLCSNCNIGKGKVIHWLMGAPFLPVDSDMLTKSLRYCVLARNGGRCSVSECEETSKTDKLTVCLRVPYGKGGRFIFDNLDACCSMHHSERLSLMRTASTRRRYQMHISRRQKAYAQNRSLQTTARYR